MQSELRSLGTALKDFFTNGKAEVDINSFGLVLLYKAFFYTKHNVTFQYRLEYGLQLTTGYHLIC